MVPLTPEEVSATPEGICRALLVRTKLTRSVMTVAAPLPHHSLGLTAYVQSTSPIRRYSDLLVHWQLKVGYTFPGRPFLNPRKAPLGVRI